MASAFTLTLIILLYVHQVLFSIAVSSPVRLPNIQFLGMGYNLIIANPQPDVDDDGRDPGFTTINVIDLSYIQNKTTADGQYLIPDCINAVGLAGCSFETTSQQTSGDTSYSATLSQELKISSSLKVFGGISFSGSESYQSLSQQTYNYSSIFMAARGVCPTYQATVLPFFNVTQEFMESVNRLPLNVDVNNSGDPYFMFLDAYGTHYTTQILMGSKYVRRYQFEQESWSQMYWDQVNINVAAQVEFGIYTGSASSATEQQRKWAEQYQQSSTQLFVSSLGSNPPTDGNISTWIQQSITQPYPITYTLNLMTALFSSEYIFNSNQSQLDIKSNNLKQAMNVLCDYTQNCRNHQNDITPVNIAQEEGQFSQDAVHVNCPVSYTLLFCGFQRHTNGGDIRVYPSSSTSCYCQMVDGNYEATCYALCIPTNLITGWQLASGIISANNAVTVTCPTGKHITGCMGRAAGKPGIYYPYDCKPKDVSSCLCTGINGAGCYGVCIDNSYDVKIYENGTNTGATVIANCEGEQIVLGCGAEHLGESLAFGYHVSDVNQCSMSGSGSEGGVVYAVCGNIKSNNQSVVDSLRIVKQLIAS